MSTDPRASARALVRSMRTLLLSGLPEQRQELSEALDDLLAHVWDGGYAAAWEACHDQSDETNPFREAN